jgi:hypothetical protein
MCLMKIKRMKRKRKERQHGLIFIKIYTNDQWIKI